MSAASAAAAKAGGPCSGPAARRPPPQLACMAAVARPASRGCALLPAPPAAGRGAAASSGLARGPTRLPLRGSRAATVAVAATPSPVSAPHGHGGSTEAAAAPGSFVAEMRARAMQFHRPPSKESKEAGAGGHPGGHPHGGPATGAAAGAGGPPAKRDGFVQPIGRWAPTREAYLQFLVDSREVYRALEDAIASPEPAAAAAGDSSSRPPAVAAAAREAAYAPFRASGLERGPALDADIAWLCGELKLPSPPPPGPAGVEYASFLRGLAASDPPAFLCHFYNVYFAHSAGGRMIGSKLADLLLGGRVLEFYKWPAELKTEASTGLLDAVRAKLDAAAGGWSRAQKDACLDETEASFRRSGALMKPLAMPGPH